MALRDFQDSQGTRWTVWNVAPSFALGSAFSNNGAAGHEGQALAEGWLCFESETEKRRLAPVPEQWEELTSGALAELLGRAQVVTRRAA